MVVATVVEGGAVAAVDVVGTRVELDWLEFEDACGAVVEGVCWW